MSFVDSASGRLFSLGFGLAFCGAGAAILASGPASLALLALGFLFGIVCSIVAVGVGLGEHPFPIAMSLIALPFGLFLFSQIEGLLAQTHSPAAYGLLALGAAAIARSAFAKDAPAAHTAPAHEPTLHAH